MARTSFAIIALSFLLALSLGYIAFNITDTSLIGFSEVGYPPPETVNLPIEKRFGMGEFVVKIEAIPGEPNAIQIKATASAIRERQTREWTQYGTGTIEFNLDRGKDRYYLDIMEMNSNNQEVTSVKFALRCRYISGPR